MLELIIMSHEVNISCTKKGWDAFFLGEIPYDAGQQEGQENTGDVQYFIWSRLQPEAMARAASSRNSKKKEGGGK